MVLREPFRDSFSNKSSRWNMLSGSDTTKQCSRPYLEENPQNSQMMHFSCYGIIISLNFHRKLMFWNARWEYSLVCIVIVTGWMSIKFVWKLLVLWLLSYGHSRFLYRHCPNKSRRKQAYHSIFPLKKLLRITVVVVNKTF